MTFSNVKFLFITVPGKICQNFRQIQIFAQYPLIVSSGPRSSHPCCPGRVDPQPTKFEPNKIQ